jgi:hypothetical protein
MLPLLLKLQLAQAVSKALFEQPLSAEAVDVKNNAMMNAEET